MKPNTNVKDYEEQIIDVDELGGTDIKINPDFYIHHALIQMSKALANPDLKEGLSRYVLYAQHIETLAKAAKMIDDKYTESIRKYKEEIKFNNDTLGLKVQLADKKIELRDGTFTKKKITNLDEVKENDKI